MRRTGKKNITNERVEEITENDGPLKVEKHEEKTNATMI